MNVQPQTDPAYQKLKQELHGLLRSCLSKGEVTLSSGKASKYYFDGKLVTLSARGAYLIAELFLPLLHAERVSAFGGLTLGADPIVAAIAARSATSPTPIQAFIVRIQPKRHGTQKWIEGPVPPAGARVALVDDVVTTGNSILTAAARLGEVIKANVIRAYCLVDRLEGAREALAQRGIPLEALFTRNDFSL